MKRPKISFTITEILIVLVIIAVLATLALPRFLKTMEKAKLDEAINNLNLIRTGEKIYFLGYERFCGSLDHLVNTVKIEHPQTSDAYFTYTITSADAIDFTAEAQRKADAVAPYNGYWYRISKDGDITSDGPFFPNP